MNNIIVSKLLGGLGNQMFQFAAGYELSNRLNFPYYLDVTKLNKYNKHNGFELNEVFHYNFKIVNKIQLFNLLKFKAYFIANESIKKNDQSINKINKQIFREYSVNYNSDFRLINEPCYISGYWQSEKYFKDVEIDLRKIFTFKNPLNTINNNYSNKIINSNSVCVHVRRGDYVSNLKTLNYHGICDLKYYKTAIDLISKKIENPKFYIFSDDIEYAKCFFSQFENCEIVNINCEKNSYNDMHLMSLCKHHIIANSTFSWWGAWLAKSNNQIVVAPKNWLIGSDEIVKDIYFENMFVI